MKLWKIVQRAVIDRAVVPGAELFLRRKLLDGADVLRRVVLMQAACVVLSSRRSAGLC